MSQSNKEDSFVNVWFSEDSTDGPHGGYDHAGFYKDWSSLGSAKHSSEAERAADALRKAYPKHSLVFSDDYMPDVFSFPGVIVKPLDDIPLLTNTIFVTLSRMGSPVPGMLLDSVYFGGFDLSWEGHDFVVYNLVYPQGFGTVRATFILHDGPEDDIRSFLLANGIWRNKLHNEIWVFNQGFWSKDAALYAEVQKANWDDVILKEDFKKNLQKDVFGFFTSEELYKKLGIPWKRGLIMYGPPGNGKTISLKAIMKSCGEKDYAPLYVKSFQSFMGEEWSMAQVFNKARQLAPCVLVLEDLDSLINDRNRSFFLNQLDGLSGNDGLFLIATTNHFDRLDPGLSTRPSRFDRKYLFDDPDLEERTLYVQYWQNKLKDNEEISFPDSLVKEVAESTSLFSFAYLKEVFVSSLVILASFEDKDKPEFADVLKDQIKVLRKQLDKTVKRDQKSDRGSFAELPPPGNPRDIRALLESLSEYVATGQSQGKVFTAWDQSVPFQRLNSTATLPGNGIEEQRRKDYRAILDRITAERAHPVGPDPCPPMVPGGWGQMYAMDPTLPSSSRMQGLKG